MENCVFCSIIEKKVPADFLYEDEDFVVIRDIHPVAPLHLLVIPRRHIVSINELEESDVELAGRLLLTAKRIARGQLGNDRGYRLVINTGAEGGQTVFHLHLHILAGRHISPELLTRGCIEKTTCFTPCHHPLTFPPDQLHTTRAELTTLAADRGNRTCHRNR